MNTTHPLKVLLAIATLMLSHHAISQDLNQVELNHAESIHLEGSEFMLRKAYEQLLSALSEERARLLKISQSKWLEYRDANLEVVYSGYAGGTIAPLIYAKRAIEMNENRTAELATMYLHEVTP